MFAIFEPMVSRLVPSAIDKKDLMTSIRAITRLNWRFKKMKILLQLTVTCALGLALNSIAAGQAPYGGVPGLPPNGPGYSPYLNLLRSGNSAGFNYYGLVRPQLDAANAFKGLQQQIGANQQNIAQIATDQRGLPVTGHTAVFLNTGGYFLNMSGGANAGTLQKKPGIGGAAGPTIGNAGGTQASYRH
jgi:hypothetical protein